MDLAIRLRAEDAGDLEFLKRLYASSREREMVQLQHWNAEEKQSFLDGQFQAQRSYYRQHYPDASYDVIERDDANIGRFYVFTGRRELNLMDITLLPEQRGTGLGTALVQDLQRRAAAESKVLVLHVEGDNPARRLYERLGFVEVGTITFYKRMHWVPQGCEAVSEALAAEAQAQAG